MKNLALRIKCGQYKRKLYASAVKEQTIVKAPLCEAKYQVLRVGGAFRNSGN